MFLGERILIDQKNSSPLNQIAKQCCLSFQHATHASETSIANTTRKEI